jgi:phytoene/squalene synthetase
VQRRTVRTLMVSSAFGYFGFLSVAAIVGLLSAEILGSDSLAGLPAAAETVGTALAAAPLALRSNGWDAGDRWYSATRWEAGAPS